KWKKGDLMLMASTPQGPIARVFLGSTATELLPHIRVPILVHPACG
ncbi:MAG: universal stress protein, partial [Corynebacterium sp.]|nr:universal stress protein [Corynebacterium sp.]